jgi:hypothetical protein
MDSYNFKAERGLATYHRAHIFVFSYIYPLPFWTSGTEWYKKALGGWQLSGVTTLQTGLPLNLSIVPDQAGIGQTGQRPNVIGYFKSRAERSFSGSTRRPSLCLPRAPSGIWGGTWSLLRASISGMHRCRSTSPSQRASVCSSAPSFTTLPITCRGGAWEPPLVRRTSARSPTRPILARSNWGSGLLSDAGSVGAQPVRAAPLLYSYAK